MLGETAAGWHIRFVTESPAPDAIVLASFGHPLNCRAVATPVDFAQMLALVPPASGDTGGIELLTVPLASPLAPDLNRQLEAWPGAGQARGSIIEASLRSTRVLAGTARAAVFSKADQMDEAVDATLRFMAAQRSAALLERDVEVNLDAMAAYAVPATKTAVPDPRSRQARMHDALGTKVAWIGLQRSLEQFDPAIPAHARRLFADLCQSARLPDRMECLEEPIHAVYDYYDAEAWRRDDQGHFNVTIVAELLILVVLIAELGVMVAQYWWPMH